MLTQARLHELIRYDHQTGQFFWRKIRKGVSSTDQPAGCVGANGYIYISVDNNKLLAHRIAWLYVYGEWPDYHLDHINHNTQDNRIENLRDAPRAINMHNQRKAHVDSLTGFMGVTFEKARNLYVAKITVNRKSVFVGRFKTAQAAHDAFIKKKRELHIGTTL